MSTIKSNQKGEIVTILTVGTLVVLSAITLVSSILLPKNKQTTASRAEDPTTCSNPNKPIDFCIREECDTAISKWVMIEKFCNNEKKIIEKAGAATNRSCTQAGKQCCGGGTTSCTLPAASTSTQTSGGNTATGNATTTTGSAKSNGCFSLKAEFEQKLENGKVAFYTWVTFESATAGDVELLANGQHAAGWNGFGGGRFTYDPNWTHPGWPGNWGPIAIVDLGKSVTAGYEGFVRNCNPQSTTINCTLTANSNGIGSVSGESGCVCKNCATASAAAAPVAAAAAATVSGGVAPSATPKPTQTPCEEKKGACFDVDNRITKELNEACPTPDKYQKGMGCPSNAPYCCFNPQSSSPSSTPVPSLTITPTTSAIPVAVAPIATTAPAATAAPPATPSPAAASQCTETTCKDICLKFNNQSSDIPNGIRCAQNNKIYGPDSNGECTCSRQPYTSSDYGCLCKQSAINQPSSITVRVISDLKNCSTGSRIGYIKKVYLTIRDSNITFSRRASRGLLGINFLSINKQHYDTYFKKIPISPNPPRNLEITAYFIYVTGAPDSEEIEVVEKVENLRSDEELTIQVDKDGC